MTDRPNSQKDGGTVDRRGTSVLVPVAIGAVFVVLAVLMIVRSGHQDAQAPPTKTSSQATKQ